MALPRVRVVTLNAALGPLDYRVPVGMTVEPGAVVVAPAPERPVDGGMATAALIAHVVVSKFCDSLPLYRQAQIYARQGVSLDRSTLAGWVGSLRS